MSDTVAAETTATEEKREAPPALHMHDVERTYRQGDETLHILRGADLAPETSVAHRHGGGGDQFAIKPRRGLDGRQLVKRQGRQGFDGDGLVAKLTRHELFHLAQMIGRDDPDSVGFALDAARHAAHGFEPANVRFGKTLASGRVVAQMGVDGVAPAVRRRDLDYGSIDGTDAAAARRDLDDRVVGDRVDRFPPADFGIMGAPVDAVHQQIVTVVVFVSQATHDDAADDRVRPLGRRVIDDAIGRRAVQIPRRQFTLHGADNIAALAYPAQRVRQPGFELPAIAAEMGGKVHAGELLQAADAK